MAGTVANRVTAFNLAALQNSGLETDDLPHRINATRLRVDAEEGGSWAHEVEVKRGAEKDPRRRSQAGGHAAQPTCRGDEPLALKIVLGVPRLVGASEMADQRAPADFALLRRLGDDVCFELRHRQAETRHSGINVQHRWKMAMPAGGPRPRADLPRLVEDGGETAGDELLSQTGAGAVQDGYFATAGNFATQCDPLVER